MVGSIITFVTDRRTDWQAWIHRTQQGGSKKLMMGSMRTFVTDGTDGRTEGILKDQTVLVQKYHRISPGMSEPPFTIILRSIHRLHRLTITLLTYSVEQMWLGFVDSHQKEIRPPVQGVPNIFNSVDRYVKNKSKKNSDNIFSPVLKFSFF